MKIINIILMNIKNRIKILEEYLIIIKIEEDADLILKEFYIELLATYKSMLNFLEKIKQT